MAPPFQYESQKVHEAIALPASERKRIVSQIAFDEGAKAATYFSAVWWPTLAYLAYRRPTHFFNTTFNASFKTAVAIFPTFLVFTFVSEQVASRLANPNAFLKDVHRHSALPPWKRYANFVADHPIENLVFTSLPVIGFIFKKQLGEKALSTSQKLMHTRVLAQFSVLTLLAANMGFYDYVKHHGKFLEPWELVAEADQQQRRRDGEFDATEDQHHHHHEGSGQ